MHRSTTLVSLGLLGLVFAAARCACGNPPGPGEDSGTADGSEGADASTPPDASAPGPDAGRDAGPIAGRDAGPDAGNAGPDAGRPDAGNPGPDAGNPGPDAGSGTHAIKTVFVIMMENQNWDEIQGNSSATYINSLLSTAAYATNYHGATNSSGPVHPSEPNYLWLEAGDNFGVTLFDDNDPCTGHNQTTTDHLVTYLNNAGVSWKSYQEDISGTDCPTYGVNQYACKHNPMVFFNDDTNLSAISSACSAGADTYAYCISHMRPYTELSGDLSSGNVARYNFITPNLCDDMHDSCAPTSDNIKQGDTWLGQNVPMIMNSSAFKQGGAIFIIWDESEGQFTDSSKCGYFSFSPDCPIGMIVLSPLGKTGPIGDPAAPYSPYSHSSTLKTMQEIFGVTPLLRAAGNSDVADLGAFFNTFP